MSLDEKTLKDIANTIRFLSVDAVNKAGSGHPGMPMGMAEIGAVLWAKHLKFNPSEPNWINRDRFVLSNGHGSMFLYSLLHLAGFGLTIEDLKNFRQLSSHTPGHPESFETKGVECTTGPLGQGIANAVGMAIGQKSMSAKYGGDVSDHQVYCVVGDGCLMEGISYEACSLAGHLGLGNLNVIYDDNSISIAGSTGLAFSDDCVKRFEAQGWATKRIDGHEISEIDGALEWAKSISDQPCLILARTIIGKGSPHQAGKASAHGSPLGEEEAKLAKEKMGWNVEQDFWVPETVSAAFEKRANELKLEYKTWLNSFESWKSSNQDAAKKLELQLSGKLPDNLGTELLSALPEDGKAIATRKLSQMVIQKAAILVEGFIGGSADLEPSTLTVINDSEFIEKGSYLGSNIHFGVREHAMGAIVNGLSYYGAFVPFGSTFLCFADYMRPSIRLAALSKLRSIFVFTHDSVFLGEDGPTHQPVEHFSALRIIPNLYVMRPADRVETAMCYALALRREDGPSALCLTRQSLAAIERLTDFDPEEVLLGGYSVYQSEDGEEPQIVFVATGSEVALSIQVAKELEVEGHSIRVVSLPCVERFEECSAAYKNTLIPREALTVVVEAGTTFGWSGLINADPEKTLFLGIDRFGISAPAADIAEQFGFTAKNLLERVRGWITDMRD